MSGTKDTGGPAFPAVIPLVHSERQGKDYPDYSEAGMTLRDYFAAKAMAAMYTSAFEWEPTGEPRDTEGTAIMLELAQDAYGIADAMLKARNQ